MFEYKVEWWDETEGDIKIDNGLINATSYSDAAEHVVAFYGRNNVCSMQLMESESLLCADDIRALLSEWEN